MHYFEAIRCCHANMDRNQNRNFIGARVADMSELPMVRLNSATILIKLLDSLDLPTDEILDGVGLRRAAFLDDEIFVSALVVYQLCENAAVAAGDHTLLASLGETVDTSSYPPVVEAHKNAQDLGQFLMRFTLEATKHSTSVTEHLDVQGDRAVFSGRRNFAPAQAPAQIDGFYVGLVLSIIRRAVRASWNPLEVTVTVCDPTALPPFMFGVKAIKGDWHGHRIGFPAEWLTLRFDSDDFLIQSKHEAELGFPARRATEAVEQALEPHVGVIPLTSEIAAKLCGMNQRSLGRILEKENSSLGTILTVLKKNYAEKMLSGSEHSIDEISRSLGYSNSTSFTRSFKAWVGKTPSEFRKHLS